MFEEDIPREDSMLLQLDNLPKPVLVDCRDIVKLRSWKNTWYSEDNKMIRTTKNFRTINLSNFIMDDLKCKFMFDHENLDVFDVTRKNLRSCNYSKNAANAKKRKDSFSKFKGVSWAKDRSLWRSKICFEYKQIHLGFFKTEVEAALAYDVAALKYFGKFALTNKMLGLL